ncbi:hypothetical protein ABXW19_11640, partial [Streptococcus suis]|uniref:hypothetical protein n=1 Tax=Streptococcus suis TaxID=1307 RepID=UPI003CF5827C
KIILINFINTRKILTLTLKQSKIESFNSIAQLNTPFAFSRQELKLRKRLHSIKYHWQDY